MNGRTRMCFVDLCVCVYGIIKKQSDYWKIWQIVLYTTLGTVRGRPKTRTNLNENWKAKTSLEKNNAETNKWITMKNWQIKMMETTASQWRKNWWQFLVCTTVIVVCAWRYTFKMLSAHVEKSDSLIASSIYIDRGRNLLEWACDTRARRGESKQLIMTFPRNFLLLGVREFCMSCSYFAPTDNHKD